MTAPHGNEEYLKSWLTYWRNIRDQAVPEFRVNRPSVDEDGVHKISWKQATEINLRQMEVFSRYARRVDVNGAIRG